ncbi:hypothetical protein KVV02_002343 [Mortierella alpina]|uniref:Uncharacterized protein n=1 Tax=Mortierella alpina TaxID=64518 RepID=A0A9P8A0Z4_MORAP|nr:hypothetical protein KVV02_002343 [Mortierella alpina]
MLEVTAPSRRTVILSISAIVGLTAVYLLYRDSQQKKQQPSRRFRALQRNLYSQLVKVEDSLDDLVDHDLRLIQVRTKTLRTHRLYPGDHHVQLPSLGLLNNHEQQQHDQGKTERRPNNTYNNDGDDDDLIEETKEELIRERTQGFDDPERVRQAYKHLDVLVKALRKQLDRLSERVELIDLSELVELGDESQQSGGGILSLSNNSSSSSSGSNDSDEVLVCEKIRRRRRVTLLKIQKVDAKLRRIHSTYQDRLIQIKQFDKLERIGLEPSDDVEPTVESEMMKGGVTFAEVAKLNIEEPEVLAPTEDLERMKQGISFADVVAENMDEGEQEGDQDDRHHHGERAKDIGKERHEGNGVLEPTEDLEKMKQGISFAEVAAHHVDEEGSSASDHDKEVLAPTEDLEKMREGVTFAEIAKQNVEEPEVLAHTEDLDKMKEGVTFAAVAKHHPEEQHDEEAEVLAPTEDLEKMKEGVTFAEVAKHNTEQVEDAEVLAPTEDLEKMKQGFTFADAVAE